MNLTLFVRTYPAKDAPVALSFFPDPAHQRHTFTRGARVYDSESREMQVSVPDGAVVDPCRRLLHWAGDKGKVKSTVNEVYELVQTRASGFGQDEARPTTASPASAALRVMSRRGRCSPVSASTARMARRTSARMAASSSGSIVVVTPLIMSGLPRMV